MKDKILRKLLPVLLVFALLLSAKPTSLFAQAVSEAAAPCDSYQYLFGGFVGIHSQAFQLLTIVESPVGSGGLTADSSSLCTTAAYDLEVPSGVLLTSTPKWRDQYGTEVLCQKSVGTSLPETWNCPAVTTAGQLMILAEALPQAKGVHNVSLKWSNQSLKRTILVDDAFLVMMPVILNQEVVAQ